MVQFINASLYGTPYVNVNASMVSEVIEEKTVPTTCTLRFKSKSANYRVLGTFDEVCDALGRDKEEFTPKDY